jgi:hypothetical protein
MDKMMLEMQIRGKNRSQIIKRMLTMTKFLIDEMGEYDTQCVKYTLKKIAAN